MAPLAPRHRCHRVTVVAQIAQSRHLKNDKKKLFLSAKKKFFCRTAMGTATLNHKFNIKVMHGQVIRPEVIRIELT